MEVLQEGHDDVRSHFSCFCLMQMLPNSSGENMFDEVEPVNFRAVMFTKSGCAGHALTSIRLRAEH